MKEVKDIMTKDVKPCSPNSDLGTAAELMWKNDCGALPLIDDDSGDLVGMITDRDICIALATKDCLASALTAREVSSGEVYSCFTDDDIETALDTMRKAKVRRLPVLNHNGELQGILSINDIVLMAEKPKGHQVPDITYEDAVITLKAICEHRLPKPVKQLSASAAS